MAIQQQQQHKNMTDHRPRTLSLSPTASVVSSNHGGGRKISCPSSSFLITFGSGILVGFLVSTSMMMMMTTTMTSSTTSTTSTTTTLESRYLENFHLQLRKQQRGSLGDINVGDRRGTRLGGQSTDADEMSTLSWSSNENNSGGWKTIQVFYGNTSHIVDASDIPVDYYNANSWFSQARQDEIISKLLRQKRNGYFIDLASNDAIRLSNTYALETHFGWNGLCIEPNPIYWTGLSYRKCDVVGAVVGSQRMEEVRFRFPRSKAPKGGIIGSDYDNKDDRWNESHLRYTVPLEEIFERHRVPSVIDYFNLDVEGAEELVLRAFPFHRYQFNLLTIERPSDKVSRILQANGYLMLKTLKAHGDTLWVHNSAMKDDEIDQTALQTINSEQYKYRENTRMQRIAPEEQRGRMEEMSTESTS